MANLTFYKVAAVVYDIYCKSQLSDNKIPIYKIVEYHKIGKPVCEAMHAMGIYEVKGSKIIWKANHPTIELIEKINIKRKEISDLTNSRMYEKTISKEIEKIDISEIEKYKNALEKALIKINELEKKEDEKQQEKKSFISKLFF